MIGSSIPSSSFSVVMRGFTKFSLRSLMPFARTGVPQAAARVQPGALLAPDHLHDLRPREAVVETAPVLVAPEHQGDPSAFCSTTRYPSASSNVLPARSQYGLNDSTGS